MTGSKVFPRLKSTAGADGSPDGINDYLFVAKTSLQVKEGWTSPGLLFQAATHE